jgi:RNA polymerase sigma-70 factor, ECF subfamily
MKPLANQPMNLRPQDDLALHLASPTGEKDSDPDLRDSVVLPPGKHYAGEAEPVQLPSPLEPGSDEQLLDEYRHGDKASFTRLVERYQRELFHFLVRFVGNRAAAEDIFQETFLQIHQSAKDFDVRRRFRPWLFTIAANKARDLIRAQARRPTNALQAPITPGDELGDRFIDLQAFAEEMPGDALEREELAARVQTTIARMPASLREILLLAYFEQFPYKQISDILGIPLGTVKSRLHSAVADFANRWNLLNNSTGPS